MPNKIKIKKTNIFVTKEEKPVQNKLEIEKTTNFVAKTCWLEKPF